MKPPKNMIRLIAVLAALALTACTVANVRSPQGASATYASLGGDSTGINITPGTGILIADNKNSGAFKTAAVAGTLAYGMHQAAGVLGTRYAEKGLTGRAGIAGKTTQHGAEQATARAIDGNATTKALSEIEAAKAIRLKELELAVPAPVPQP